MSTESVPAIRVFSLVILLVVGLTVAPIPAVAAEDPRFETYVPDPMLVPGETTQVTVKLVNDAKEVDERVETVRNVKATMKEGKTPFTVRSGTRLLGRMADGVVTPVQFTLSVPQDVDAGTFRVPIELTYEYEDDERETKTVHATFRIEERARFRLQNASADLPVSGTGIVTLAITNVGEASAYNATVQIQSETDDLTFGTAAATTRFIGQWKAGKTRRVTLEMRASDGATTGTNYSLTSTVAYEDGDGNQLRSLPMNAGIELLPEQSFVFQGVTSSLQVGEEGIVSATVRNQGPFPVTDAVVMIGQTDPTIQPAASEYAIGPLAAGESETIRFPITVASSAESIPRRLPFRVSYRNTRGDLVRSDTIFVRTAVRRDRDRFSLSHVESTLRVGAEGEIQMTVTNHGPAIQDAVITLVSTGQNIHPLEGEYALGSLPANGSTTVRFPIEVSDSAEAIPRQFRFQIGFEDREGDQQNRGPYNVRVAVADEREQFVVERVSASTPAGGSSQLTLRVTNNGDVPIRNVDAKIFTDDPLSTGDDQAFIETLKPGASETVTFSIAASGAALEKRYPVSIDFQYDEQGDSKLSETYQVAVTVTEPKKRQLPLPLIAGGGVVALAIVAVLLYRRR
ncbi:MAG: COG1361 S-layer family protein [Halodesulfurarchaeum sp.]